MTSTNPVTRLRDAGLRVTNQRESRVGDNHHHLLCRECGRIEDVDCAKGERPCLHPADENGFVIDEAEVIYWGLCPACAGTARAGE